MQRDRAQDNNTTNQQQGMKKLYGDFCTKILSEITAQHDNPAPGSGWTVEHNKQYGISTWTLREDKALGRTGSNGQLQVKLFDRPDSYDFVKTEDFIARGELICDAAKMKLKQFVAANPPQQEKAMQALLWVNKLREDFKLEIQHKAAIDPVLIRAEDLDHFKAQYGTAKHVIRQLLGDIASGLCVLLGQTNRENMISELQQAEKEVLTERGRPVVIKIGNMGDPESPIKMVSAQFPQGAETVTSSLRDGNYATKLSNHVLDGSGVVVNGQVKFDVMIDGHSSYTPITEESEWRRLYVGGLALKEKLGATATDIQKMSTDASLGRSADNPILISLSTMMLLTPLGVESLENKFMKHESESMQVAEAHLVMELARNSPQPLELRNRNGESVFVHFDHTAMNIPSNALASTQKIKGSAIQDHMNTIGFLEYVLNMRENTKKNLPHLNEFLGTNLVNDLLKTGGMVPRPVSVSLSGYYNDLNRVLEKHANEPDTAKKTSLEEQCKNIFTKIEANEKDLAKRLDSVVKNYEKAFLANAPRLYAAVDAKLKDDSLPAEVKDFLLMQKRFLTAQEMYFNKSYLDPENAYQFQALYILSNQQLDRHLEAFCKSGEDRTGWMRVTLLAMTAFHEQHGRDPDFKNPDDKAIYQKNFINAAHELSASLENTAYNSASRGLQVVEKCTTSEKLIVCDKLMAILAKKGVYDDKSSIPKSSYQFITDHQQFKAVITSVAVNENRNSLLYLMAKKSRSLTATARHGSVHTPKPRTEALEKEISRRTKSEGYILKTKDNLPSNLTPSMGRKL